MCEICLCLARGGVRGEWITELGVSITYPVDTGGVLDVYLCLGCGGVGDACGEWLWCLDYVLEGGGVMSV